MTSTKKLNVLVYSGNGSTVESVRQCLYTLRRLLAPNYAVIPVTGEMIVDEPWTAACALLVMPGGADQGYCRTLNGDGNRRIAQFVRRGGAYIGFCAGGYYGSKKCEFEVGDKKMEVVGSRELAFFPGTCRGCAFSGFVYHSEEGARAAELKVEKTTLEGNGSIPDTFKSYYNGGGVFVDAAKYADQGVEVIANYTEPLNVDSGEGAAAVVYCKVGDGAALLTGPHPEFAPANLDRNSGGPGYNDVVDSLAADDELRIDFLKACLTKLGLRVNQESSTVPSLSRVHLSSAAPHGATELVSSFQDIIVVEDGEEYIKDDNDTFHLEKTSSYAMKDLEDSLPSTSEEKTDQGDDHEDRIVDYNTIVKRMVVHDSLPASKETPYFNHFAFYANLKHYRSQYKGIPEEFGSNLLYGEVVTSTNTILEKNTQLLRRLPTGFTATATVQVAGRGRGSNIWVSPAGALMFSTVLRHPIEKMNSAPIVFIQYLAAMAIVDGIKKYDHGYSGMPIKLKWPNDIYALDHTNPDGKTYTKIGGILVNSHYSSNEYISVVGMGINATNSSPTTSLNALLPFLPASSPPHQPFTLEKLLASILTSLEDLHTHFLAKGFDSRLENLYYSNWLHMDQIVTLEAEGGARARIKGITKDYGLLVAEELGWEDRPTGKTWQLQSDSNSFDFFKGLVKRKV